MKAGVTTREELFASLQLDPAGMHIVTPQDDHDADTDISPFTNISPLRTDDSCTVTVSTLSLFHQIFVLFLIASSLP
jgi:hypothetical protein